MILTDADETPSRRFPLIAGASDVRLRSGDYFDGYVDCLRDHMRQSHRRAVRLVAVAVVVAVLIGVFALIGEFSDGWL